MSDIFKPQPLRDGSDVSEIAFGILQSEPL
jgi:hypothetical protein